MEGAIVTVIELIDEIIDNLSVLKTDTDDPALKATVHRNTHSLKGCSGTLGFTEMQDLSLAIETYFKQIQLGLVNFSTIHLKIVKICMEMIKLYLEDPEYKGHLNFPMLTQYISSLCVAPEDVEMSANKVKEILLQVEFPPRFIFSDSEESRLANALENGIDLLSISISMKLEVFCKEDDNSHDDFKEMLAKVGEVICTQFPDFDQEDLMIFVFILATTKTQDQVVKELETLGIKIKFEISGLVQDVFFDHECDSDVPERGGGSSSVEL